MAPPPAVRLPIPTTTTARRHEPRDTASAAGPRLPGAGAGMTARRLGPRDDALWQALWDRARAEAPAAFASARETGAMAWRRDTARAFVWEEEGQPLATGLWCRDEDPGRPDRGWVEAVYVLPAARGRRIADRLLAALASDAAGSGMAELWLEVGRNNTAAQRAYARAGFGPAPEAAARRDEIALMRRLEPCAPAG